MAHSGGTESFYDDNQNIEDATPDKKVFFYKKRYEELQTEFEEFQYSSRELENELETQLSHYERRIRELEANNLKLNNENDVLRNKLERITAENIQQNTTLQEKLDEVTAINEQLTNHIRELEQSNDDLERAKRHLDATLSDFDAKLNEQIERNELLESEIGEKEELQVVIQRLKDEARDLRLELMIQQNVKSKKSISSPEVESPNSTSSSIKRFSINSLTNNNISSNSNANSAATTPVLNSNNTIINNNLNEDNNKNCNNNNITNYNNINNNNNSTVIRNNSMKNTNNNSNNQIPLLSASSRISALNIVSDLLRKVGALESKLASCRNIMPISNSTTKSTTITNSNGKTPTTTTNNDVSNERNSVNNNNSTTTPTTTLKNINANA